MVAQRNTVGRAMDWNTIYLAINLAVIPAWALLIFLPRSELTRALVHSILYPVAFGLVYAASLGAAMVFGVSAEGAGFSSIGAVAAIFDHPNGVITGWSHYLVFDLFVGAWIGRDAARLALPHLLVAPCLFFTFMFGPTGLLAYVLLRLTMRGKAGLAET